MYSIDVKETTEGLEIMVVASGEHRVVGQDVVKLVREATVKRGSIVTVTDGKSIEVSRIKSDENGNMFVEDAHTGLWYRYKG